MNSTLSLEARGIQKAFPGVLALQDVKLTMRGGSIHALLGENGAGKSTLIKIITGVYRPDEGELRLNGAPVRFEGPRDAIAAGVGVVHQERNLIPRFSVGENIMLERLDSGLMRPIDYDAVHAEARRWLEVLELDLDPRTPVSQLNVAKVQLVEIAKALSLRSRVLLLDEPTASLTPQEAEVFFRLLRKLRDEGASLLFVSHKLEEVQQICDEVTVLRDGRNACPSQPMAGLGRQDLVRLMIGRNEQIPDWAPSDHSHAETMLALKNISTPLGHAEIDLTVRQGRDRRPLRPRRRWPDGTRQVYSGPLSADRRPARDRGPTRAYRQRRRRYPSLRHRLYQRGSKAGGPDPRPYRARERRDHNLAQARRPVRPVARRNGARACLARHR